MKVNRYKNPYFWVGVLGVILTSLQVEASSLTSWNKVWVLILGTLQNPFLLGTTIMGLLGVFTNHPVEEIENKKEKEDK